MKYIIILSVAVLLACRSNTFETMSGTVVSYVEKGEGEWPVDSLVGLYSIQYTTQEGKVMKEVGSDNPLPLKIDPNNISEQGELYEILSKLRIGDSVGFELVASELFAKTFRAPVPDSIPPESKIKFQVAFLDQLSETGYFDMVAEKQKKLAEKQLVVDAELLDGYMEAHTIEVEQTESGLRYVVTEDGKGEKPEDGQLVKVHYAGRILDGEYFDTSIESVAREQGLYQEGRPYQPFAFQLGKGRVIKGWDEGIALLSVGSKATFYIPSPLGYGSRGSGPVIKPNAILVFDVELVGVEK